MAVALSVNVNKVATLRNARGGDVPNFLKVCELILSNGVHGITVHPRPDERHIRYQDVVDIKTLISHGHKGKEFNIEGNPKVKKFVDLVLKVKPEQVTLVPDDDQQITSDHGWDVIKEFSYLKEVIALFKKEGIRTSLFLDPHPEMVVAAHATGTDRIELYTESYAKSYSQNPASAVREFVVASQKANSLGLSINAGHDLSLENLSYFVRSIPALKEVSIGHALISDALYFGLEKTISLYLSALQT